MDDMIEIAGAEELFAPPSEPTEAVVKVRRDENGNHQISVGDYKSEKKKGKKWIRIPFVVVGGPFNNRWATLFLDLDGKDSKFRKAFQVVTGIDMETMKAGTKMGLDDFKAKLAEGAFRAVIEQETKWDPQAKERVPTDFTAVARLLERVDESELPASSSSSSADDDEDIFGVGGSSAEAEASEDDDMPF